MKIMAVNIIFYGPPGTGKTYFMQNLLNEYTDLSISDAQIVNAYTRNSTAWLLISLVILQNRGKMRPTDIQAKITSLNLQRPVNVSAELEQHQIAPSNLGVARLSPRIFFEHTTGQWYIDRVRLQQYDPTFLDTYLADSQIEKRFSFVTFHQSFAYEDFIEGIRPTYNETTKSIDYTPKPGIFKSMCAKAASYPEKEFAVFIDEINRGNISEIFGELISLIEVDKRQGQASELSAVLPYSKEVFVIPNNINIYGTMNSADKSIAAIDIALRRRFKFTPIMPESQVIKRELEIAGVDATNIDGVNVVKLFTAINSRIELLLDANHLIGHSYFLSIRTLQDIIDTLVSRIVPLLEEYFYDDLQKIQLVLSDLDTDGTLKPNAIYRHENLSVDQFFSYVGEYLLDDKKRYAINPQVNRESLLQIYNGIPV